ncbi:MAG: ParA family protein [Ruminococcaceae bacterium]|nr:ParA family protein [Oscillospiraceae bacterium]
MGYCPSKPVKKEETRMPMGFLSDSDRITVITGHYGSGKTNLAANLAFRLREEGKEVTVVDLDIVNPYFRTADFSRSFAEAGIRLIAPVYARTNVDAPVLPPEIDSVFFSTDHVIIDVGGDDAGAFALGRYSAKLKTAGYRMLYVLNRFRYLNGEEQEEQELIPLIEAASRLKVTALVNNSHLCNETTAGHLAEGLEFAREISRKTGLPLQFSTAPKGIPFPEDEPCLPVDILVKAPF